MCVNSSVLTTSILKLTVFLAAEVLETGPEGQCHGGIHLDRWFQRCSFQDQGKLATCHRCLFPSVNCGGAQVVRLAGWLALIFHVAHDQHLQY